MELQLVSVDTTLQTNLSVIPQSIRLVRLTMHPPTHESGGAHSLGRGLFPVLEGFGFQFLLQNCEAGFFFRLGPVVDERNASWNPKKAPVSLASSTEAIVYFYQINFKG